MNRSGAPSPSEVCAPPGKPPTQEPDDPFATFSEWSDDADEKAYGSLWVRNTLQVMPDIEPGIHVFTIRQINKTWMAGT